MDSFEVNKILGAVLGTLTFVLGLSIASEILFEPHAPEKQGYDLPAPVESAGGAAAAAPAVEPIAVRLAKADPAKGEGLIKQCGSCHSFEKGGANKVGPNLYGVAGNHHAHLEGFNYSAGMKAKSGEQWTFEALDHFLENPKAAVPGTAMSFAGIKRPDQRADVIAYLNKNSDAPLPLPAADAAPAAEAGAPGVPTSTDAAPNLAPAGGPTGATGVPQPQTAPAGTPATPPTGAAEGGTPEVPQGNAGSGASKVMPHTDTHQPQQ